jgi:hypothetical protein
MVAGDGAARGARTVTPILLTALVTGFALVPLALETGQSGARSRGRWRWSFWAGLSSLALTLLLLPALIWRWRMPVAATTGRKPDNRLVDKTCREKPCREGEAGLGTILSGRSNLPVRLAPVLPSPSCIVRAER